MDPKSPNMFSLAERLEALTAFLPALTDPAFSFGTWEPLTPRDSGTWTLPTFTFSETASAFVQAAYDAGWVDLEFNWMAWSETDDAKALLAEPSAIGTATVRQLEQLLTTCIRMDRYCEGSLAGDLERGVLVALVERARDVLQAERPADQSASIRNDRGA